MRLPILELETCAEFQRTEYEEEIYKLACTYMAKTEEYDRGLSDFRCKYDETAAFIPNPILRQLSQQFARDLWKMLDPYHTLKGDILSEIKRYSNYTAQHWIDEYYRIIKGKQDADSN